MVINFKSLFILNQKNKALSVDGLFVYCCMNVKICSIEKEEDYLKYTWMKYTEWLQYYFVICYDILYLEVVLSGRSLY